MASRLSQLLRDDTAIIESMGKGFGEAEEKASLRHDEAMSRFDELAASNKEVLESNQTLIATVKKTEKMLEEMKASEKVPQPVCLFPNDDDNNNVVAANAVEDSQSVLTETTSATSTAQRQKQLKQKERELHVRQKRMDAKQEEKERKLNLFKKQLDEKAEQKLKKAERKYQTQMKKMEAQLKAKETKHAKEVDTLRKKFGAELGLMEKEKEKENLANSNGSIFDIKPMKQEPPEAEQKAMNEHVRTTRASRARAARGGK